MTYVPHENQVEDWKHKKNPFRIKKYCIILDSWGKDEQEALEIAGQYLANGKAEKVLTFIEELKE